MIEDYYSLCLRTLDRLATPHFLEKQLKKEYLSPRTGKQELIQKQIETYNVNIAYFSSINSVNTMIKRFCNRKNIDTLPLQEFATPVMPHSDFATISKEAALYFQQGREMLHTARAMPLTSSPLVEYYGYLQCAKGIILTELDVNQELFFSYHGITRAKPDVGADHSTIAVNVMALGVFQAFLLRSTQSEKAFKEIVDELYAPSYRLTLEEILENYYQGVFSFITSWMLSSLVRYHPLKWQEILRGETTDLRLEIKSYRRQVIIPNITSAISYIADLPPGY